MPSEVVVRPLLLLGQGLPLLKVLTLSLVSIQ